MERKNNKNMYPLAGEKEFQKLKKDMEPKKSGDKDKPGVQYPSLDDVVYKGTIIK